MEEVSTFKNSHKSSSRLAIIIPAYKSIYLKKTLYSLASQTCSDFTLYIGNDHSPYPIKNIVEKFSSKIRIIYKEFEENLGKKNLIEHWNRCVNMTQNEEYIWLFSDDDMLENRCVENFYKLINTNKNADVIHFDINYINKDDDVLKRCNPYPAYISTENFFSSLYTGKIDARMPEFIFRKSKFLRLGGFVVFDMAWRSDNATVMKIAVENGIFSIRDSRVLWRYGNENISSKRDKLISIRKNNATINFFNWVIIFFKENALTLKMSHFQLLKIYAFSFPKEKENSFSKLWNKRLSLIFINSFNKKIIYFFWIIYRLYIKHFYEEIINKNFRNNKTILERL